MDKLRLNNKGFTLVEVLTTIVITSLVLVVSFYGIISVNKNIHKKNKYISLKGIKESANIYANESSSSEWRKEEKEGQDSFEYFCVTIGELMNKGYIKKNSLLPDGYSKESFLFVKRNLLTKDIIGEYKPEDYDKNRNICNNNVIVPEEYIVKIPSYKGHSSYTDKLVIEFEKGNAKFGDNDSVSNYTCYYGDTLNTVNSDKNVTIKDNKCIINGLKNNHDYYVYIYMNTKKGSHVLASGRNKFKTTNFNDTDISHNSNQVVDIKYNSKDTANNIINPVFRYFKSSVSATSSVNVKKCDNFNCNYDTNIIEKDTWYLSMIDNIKLNYDLPKVDIKVEVNTRIKDGSNNSKDNKLEFTILSDITPPEIQIINIVDGQNVNRDKWYNKDVELNITFNDDENGTGINPKSLQFSLDNKNFSFIQNDSCSKYVDIKRDEQDSNIYYKICDYANNCSIGETKVRIDKTPPKFEFITAPGILNKYTIIKSFCSDNNNGPVTKSPEVAVGSTNLINYQCIDEAGNVSKISGKSRCKIKCYENIAYYKYRYIQIIKCGNNKEYNFSSGYIYDNEKDAIYYCQNNPNSDCGGARTTCTPEKKSEPFYKKEEAPYCGNNTFKECTDNFIFEIN